MWKNGITLRHGQCENKKNCAFTTEIKRFWNSNINLLWNAAQAQLDFALKVWNQYINPAATVLPIFVLWCFRSEMDQIARTHCNDTYVGTPPLKYTYMYMCVYLTYQLIKNQNIYAQILKIVHGQTTTSNSNIGNNSKKRTIERTIWTNSKQSIHRLSMHISHVCQHKAFINLHRTTTPMHSRAFWIANERDQR